MIRVVRRAMACEFEIVLDGDDKQTLVDTANFALDEVQRLGVELNCFNPASEVSLVNEAATHRPVVVSPELFEILSAAQSIWRETDGAFDVTAGGLIDLWREAEKTQIAPSAQAIEEALAKFSMGWVQLNEQTHEVRFNAPTMKINLGAIGKGYAVRRTVDILKEYGISFALVSGGRSTIQSIGRWSAGIRHPSKLDGRVCEIELTDQAMSTSGGPAQRDPDVDECFEHIVDPKTGAQAYGTAVSVSVITDDAMRSDALSTAIYLRGPELARRLPNIRAVFVDSDAGINEIITYGEKNE